MPRIRTIAVFPTLITLANLVCGFFAIVVVTRVDAPTAATDPTPATESLNIRRPTTIPGNFNREDPTHNLMLASWLIFLAMVFDALDGRVARLANQTTDFGSQLDSLCDLVTFGVAPAFLMVKMCSSFTYEHRFWVWIIAATFAVCAAMRLARFNVETGEDDDHLWFAGLPTPAGAAAIAGFALVFYKLRLNTLHPDQARIVDEWVQWTLPLFALLISVLMVSRIPYPHAVNQFIRRQRSFGHMVALIFALIPVFVMPEYAIPFLVAVFVLAPPLYYIWQRVYLKRAQREPIF